MLTRNVDVFAVESGVVGYDRAAARAFEPGLLARVLARVRGRALDRALIGGADPASSPQLAARAATLTTWSTRARVATALERLARTAREAPSRSRVTPFRGAIRANAPELQALAAILRGSAPVYARGVAMLRILVTDGTGPAYSDRKGGVLAEQLCGARMAIESDRGGPARASCA